MNPKLPNPTTRLETTLKLMAKSVGSPIRFYLLFVFGLFFALISANAQTARWDAHGTGFGSDGSGIWEGSTNWLVAGVDGGWPAAADAVIGSGTPGNYLIDLTVNETANSVVINTSGYTLTDQALIGTVNNSGLGSTVTFPVPLFVTNNATATLLNTFSVGGGNGGRIVLASGCTLNFAQLYPMGPGNPGLIGSDLTSVYNFTNSFHENGTCDMISCTVNIWNSIGAAGATRLDIGRGVLNAASSAIYGTGSSTLNIYGGTLNPGNLQVCRAAPSTGGSFTAPCTLNVYGGTLTTGGFLLAPDGGDNATVNITNGIIN